MKVTNYRQVIVKDEMGNVAINWWRLFFGRLTVETEQGKTMIIKQGLLRKQIYIPSEHQSVELRQW